MMTSVSTGPWTAAARHGGLLMLHDYASGEWGGATAAVDAFFRDKPERVVVMPDKSGTAIVRRCRPG